MQPVIIPKMELDELVQKLWDKAKGKWAGSATAFNQKFKPGQDVQACFTFQFLLIAIDRANNEGLTNPKAFQQKVEAELALLFPDLKPGLPPCVKNLSFMMHAAVYGRNCCPREGLSLLDEFLDLKAANLGEVLSNSKYIGSYQKLFHGNRSDIEALSKLSEPEFNEFKWAILREVLSLPGNCNAQFPGLEIIDLILGSFGLEIASILSSLSVCAAKLEPRKKPLPSCVEHFAKLLNSSPLSPSNFMDCIKIILVTSPEDEIILGYMAALGAGLATTCDGGEIISFCQNKLAFDVTSEVDACQAVIFPSAVLKIVQSIYPYKSVGGSVDLFLSSGAAQAICDGAPLTCEDILKNIDRNFLISLLFNNQQVTPDQLDQLFNSVAHAVVDGSERRKMLLQGLMELTVKTNMLSPNEVIFNCLAGPALLLRRYRFQALNHLMYREMHFMDPVISDTLCELRPPFLMDCDVIIQKELKKNHPQWKELVAAYNQNYLGKELNETLITNPLQLIGHGPDPFDYLELCWALETKLQKKGKEYYPRHLALCKSLTRSSFLIRDQLGIETGEATISTMPGNELRRRRAEMGTYNIWYTKWAAEQLLVSPEINCPAFGETANVLINCDVITPDSKFCIPLVPIYQAQTLAMLKAFELGLPIILRLKRIHIVSRTGQPKTSYKLQGVVVEENIANAEYVVAGSQVLIFMPNGNTGQFEFVPDAPDDMPGLAVSAFSILDLTRQHPFDQDPGYGNFVRPEYYLEDPVAYFEFMKTQDVVNLLNVCSANHPVFVPNAARLKAPSKYSEVTSGPYVGEIKCWTEIEKERKAKDKIPNQFNFLEGLCGQQPGALASATCTFLMGAPVNICTDIEFGHFAQFYQMGEVLQYSDRRYTQGQITVVNGPKQSNTGIIYRHCANMPFYSIHIYCSTVGAEKSRAATLHTGNMVERFQDKDEMETRAINYLLLELGRAKSMQDEPQ